MPIFFIGHTAVFVLLLTMSIVTDMALFIVLWLLMGFGDGTAYTYEEIQHGLNVGTSVKVNAASSGSVGKKEYSLRCKKQGEDKWTTIKSFSEKTDLSFTPASSGTYTLRTVVRDERGVQVTKDFTVRVRK